MIEAVLFWCHVTSHDPARCVAEEWKRNIATVIYLSPGTYNVELPLTNDGKWELRGSGGVKVEGKETP